jgi:uncharacterized membrane protein YphA (DoxX/SURF4 family)
MKTLRIASRILVGLVFIFSGFVKGVDPWGQNYKFIEYFESFRIGFLIPVALPMGILQCAAEFVIGVSLLFGLRMKVASWAALIFMAFFTLITFYLAIFNPVSDCGCFGDAIKLTNWQTFWKNIIILAFVLIIFISRKKYIPAYQCFSEWCLVAFAFLVSFGISIYSYEHLPILDFLPYNTGADIQAKMKVPLGMPADVYKTLLYYKKNGQLKEFTDKNFPWQDTTWKWVETKSVLVKEGYKPPIHDFSISDQTGNAVTDVVLNDTGYVFLMVSTHLDKANQKALLKSNAIAGLCQKNNFKFYFLTASGEKEIQSFKSKTNSNFDFYTADETTLKSMIRCNPGLILIKHGVVLAKWHYNDIPAIDQMEGNLLAKSLEKKAKQSEKLLTINLALGLLLFFALFHIITKSLCKKN